MVYQGEPGAVRCRCHGTIDVAVPRPTCTSCGTVVELDDVGVRMLAGSDDAPWTGMPSHVVDAVRRAPSADTLVDAMMNPDDPWSVALQRRLLHPASGGMAVLAEPPPGATALDLGTGCATLPVALSSLGTRVVVADWVYPRLRIGRLLHEAPATVSVHLPFGAQLPWEDGAFDLVFVDLVEVERLSAARGDGPEVKDQLLAEVRRVLRDDGVAVIGTRNRLRTALRAATSSASVRWGERLRGARGALATAPWGDAGLRRAGLVVQRVMLPHPGRDGWRWLFPGERLRDHGLRAGGARGPAVRLVLQLGLTKWLVRDYYLLVRPSSCGATGVRTLGEALSEALGDADEAPPVTMALSDARVALVGRRHFLKLPLSPDQQRALVAEVEKTTLARATAFGPFVVPASRIETWRGIPFSVSPVMRGSTTDAAAAQATVDAALDSLDASHLAPLAGTTCFTRLAGERGSRDAEEIGASRLRSAVLEGLGDRLVPVGPTHGDLHPGNVLVRDDGPALLVDWNRFELTNPLMLDAIYAATRAQQAAARITLGESLLRFVDGELTDPVAVRAGGLLGELTPLQAATVVLLDRIVSYSLPRRRYKPWTMPPLQEAVRALTARADEWDSRVSLRTG